MLPKVRAVTFHDDHLFYLLALHQPFSWIKCSVFPFAGYTFASILFLFALKEQSRYDIDPFIVAIFGSPIACDSPS